MRRRDRDGLCRSLATSLGRRAEGIFADTRDLLAGFDRSDTPRCSADHLRTSQQADVSRPYIRAIDRLIEAIVRGG